MLKLHDFCNRARSARACCQNAMMMTGAPIKLTQADAADVADLYNRCSDYFLLQDGAAPTLDDARELFSDVPPEKSAHRSEEHTSELQSLMRISYAVFCLKKKNR